MIGTKGVRSTDDIDWRRVALDAWPIYGGTPTGEDIDLSDISDTKITDSGQVVCILCERPIPPGYVKPARLTGAFDCELCGQDLTPAAGNAGDNVRIVSGPTARENHTWEPVDLADVLDGTWKPPEPTVGRRSDGVGLFYPGKKHTISSESEAGKTPAR